MKAYPNYDYSDIAVEARRLVVRYFISFYFISFQTKFPDITYAYSFLIEYNKSTFEVDKIKEALHVFFIFELFIQFCDVLQEYDSVRKNYWEKVKDDIMDYYGFLMDTE